LQISSLGEGLDGGNTQECAVDCLKKMLIFYQQYWLRKKRAFFATAPFSRNIPRSNFIEERQAMRYISRLIRTPGRAVAGPERPSLIL
jgi:hypothetical protein